MLASLFEHISIVLKARTFYHLVRRVFLTAKSIHYLAPHLWHSLLAAVLASSRVPKDSDVVNLQEHRLRF